MEYKVVAYPKLAQQSLARELTSAESDFARVLEEIFTTGAHDFTLVAKALQDRNFPRPSGAKEAWSETILMQELANINASLDAAYAETGIGA